MLAYLFAGQGSQYIGMGKDLYDSFPESREVFEQADKLMGFSLKNTCFSGTSEAIKMTHICQPAVLTASIAAYQAYKSAVKNSQGSDPVKAVFTAGLSLGEYSALVSCGVFSFRDALIAVRRRAELMNDAAMRYPGKMAAVIGLDKDKVKGICLSCSRVWIANYNSPGQLVISGEAEAVDKAKQECLNQGAKRVIDLEVSGAFHTEMMWEAAMEFKSFLDEAVEFNQPQIPVVSNVDARPSTKITDIRDKLVRQIYSPVLWEDSIDFMAAAGVEEFIEFGPGKVLKGLVRKINPQLEVSSIEKQADLKAFLGGADAI